MAELPRGTITLVFTDIEGSTRLLESLGDSYGEVLAEHRKVLRRAFTAHGGVEVDTQGDALFYAFPRAQDAATAAVESQRLLGSHPWPANAEVRVRMGIHTGEPQTSSEGYVGPDVHRAARICAAAHGGQVLISQTTKDLIGDTGLDGATLHDLGEHALKDISARVHLHELVIDGLRSDFPPIRTLDAHPTNLPPFPTALVGREQEVTAIVAALQNDGTRLITLTGPGGTGKTRLALGVAYQLLEDFSDGVFFVDLSPITDASLVVAPIAAALSLRESGGRGLQETLHDYLASKELLLVIDNFEQVIDAASDVALLLSSAPHVRVLVTSREPLRLAGEQEFAVPPLSLPSQSSPQLEDAKHSPAVALFTERARGVRADFELTEDNVAAVIAICRRVDGLPLAIELAAARVKVLSPHGLLDRLDHSLRLLSSGRRDASERQRTLRGAISWSYELLAEDEQRLFRRLGVFSGGWSLEAAEVVCDWGDLKLEVLDGLASLVDKSLVRAMTGDEERFSMLETIREFAAERLEESGEAQEFRRAHAEYFRSLAEEAEPHLIGAEQKEWLDRLDRELTNLWGCLQFFLKSDSDTALKITTALWRFFWIRGRLREARGQIEAALAASREHPHDLRARGLSVLGVIAHAQGDSENAERFAHDALRLFRRTGNERGMLSCLTTLGQLAMDSGDLPTARRYLEEDLRIAQQLDDQRDIVVSWGNLGALALLEENFEGATELFRKSLMIEESRGDKEGITVSIGNLGIAAVLCGNASEALVLLGRALELAADIEHHELIAASLEGLSAGMALLDNVDDAAILMGAAEATRASAGLSPEAIEARLHRRTLGLLSNGMTQESLEDGVSQGRSMSLADAITWAFEMIRRQSAAQPAP